MRCSRSSVPGVVSPARTGPPCESWAAPSGGLAAIVLAALGVNAILLQGYGHLYDFPVLCAATSLFILALSQRDGVFLLAFAVACLVKESLFMFVPVYALIGMAQRPIRDVVRNAILQGTVFTVVYWWQRVHFARQYRPANL